MPFRLKSRTRTRAAGTQEFFGAQTEKIPEDYLVAHIDGGARGNPGPGGYGVVIEDHAGRKLDEIARFLGKTTNNVAEYSALIAALEYAVGPGFKALKVLSDSELLVRQMRGEYKVRNAALQTLYNKAGALARELNDFQVLHIPREENREADHLANVAMDRGMMGRASDVPAETPQTHRPLFRREKEIEGVVRDGVVEIVGGHDLPEGARVRIRVAK